MAFRVRQNHSRLFPKNTVTSEPETVKETNEDGMVEDIVFFVDEETGEIKEEKTYVKSSGNNTSQKVSVSSVTAPKNDASKVFHHKMKQVTQESFM